MSQHDTTIHRTRWSRTRFLLAALACSAAVAAGCGSDTASDASGSSDASGDSTAPTSAAPAQTGDDSAPDGADAPQFAEWQELAIEDVDGTSFTIAELAGRPVFVENFATWCSNCRKQLGDTQAAAASAGADAVFVALSVETDLSAEDVADYAAENGFDDIRFAVMTPELLAAIDDEFGTSSLNPPSTPHVVVAADGSVGELVTGFESPEQILASMGLG